MDTRTDILVAGAGAAGLAAALALASGPHRVAVVGKPDVGGASRTVALFDGSIRFLESLGVWDAVERRAQPLRTMRIVDDTGSLLRAPPIDFKSSEIGLEAFGWNVENGVLVGAMADALRARGDVAMLDTLATGYDFQPDHVRVTTQDAGSLEARLVVAADGRRSAARRAAHISARAWDYPQAAITAILAHERPHEDVSTEFHTRQGPCTLVPLPGAPDAPHRCSLVWMMTPAEAARRKALSDEAFALEVERATHSLLGKMRALTPRTLIPMEGLTARAMTAPRIALAGEAAHVFPPIGAQGLNLGLRDAAHLAEALEGAHEDPGAAETLALYARTRSADVALRSLGVDLLNRSLLTRFLPNELMRGVGMMALREIGPLRRLAMREGVLPQSGAPLVMRQRT
ncbi:MAG: Ubiquinone biosynthesis hydroxylase, UbiH/UbiF/VisC/COQ6 family, partial [Hyphomicrobiales bacterium]|nr:Ubiquinone biosynthesis hydroxylase, UbiH/UbiF/VisC/COQ6 family [Hyphomicrobiales bacterium]